MEATKEKALKSPFGLEAHWNFRLLFLKDGKYQHDLTQRQRGQLKELANKLGAQTKDVIDFAVSNWWKFARTASAKAGTSTWPTDPHVGFLLKHHAVAAQELRSIAETPKPPPLPPPPVPKSSEKEIQLAEQNQNDIENMLARFADAGEPPPPITYTSHREVIYKATKKELVALFADLEK